jgi:hypothetical protein
MGRKKKMEETIIPRAAQTYKPSNTWLVDALRFNGQCYLAVLHLNSYGDGDDIDVKKIITCINNARRYMTAYIASRVPNFDEKLSCAIMKHLPTANGALGEVREANELDVNLLSCQDNINEALALGIEKITGIKLDIAGCIECLEDVRI